MINFFSKGFRKKGFTLIELIVVMAVLAILVSVAVPQYLTHVREARLTKAANDAKIVEDALMLQASANGGAIAYDSATSFTTAEFSAKGDVYDVRMKKVSLPADLALHPVDQTEVEKYVKTDSVDFNNIVVDETGNVYFVSASGEAVEVPPESDLAAMLIASDVSDLYDYYEIALDGTSIYMCKHNVNQEITITEFSLNDFSVIRTINTGFTSSASVFMKALLVDADKIYLGLVGEPSKMSGAGFFDAADLKGNFDSFYLAFDKSTEGLVEKGIIGGSSNENDFDMFLTAGGVIFVGNSLSSDGDFATSPNGFSTMYAAYFNGTQVTPIAVGMFPGVKQKIGEFELIGPGMVAGLVQYDDFSNAVLPIEFMGMFDAYSRINMANGLGQTKGYGYASGTGLRVLADMSSPGDLILERQNAVNAGNNTIESYTLNLAVEDEAEVSGHFVDGDYHYLLVSTDGAECSLYVVRIDSTKNLSEVEYCKVPAVDPINTLRKGVSISGSNVFLTQDNADGTTNLISLDVTKLEYTK